MADEEPRVRVTRAERAKIGRRIVEVDEKLLIQALILAATTDPDEDDGSVGTRVT